MRASSTLTDRAGENFIHKHTPQVKTASIEKNAKYSNMRMTTSPNLKSVNVKSNVTPLKNKNDLFVKKIVKKLSDPKSSAVLTRSGAKKER